MSVARASVIEEARRYLGVKFRHQGRDHGGIDCAGMISVPLQALGMHCIDRTDYDRYSAGTAMPESLAQFADRIPIKEARLGDLLTFRRDKKDREEHVAWFIPPSRILHSWIKGGVCEVELDGHWKPKLIGAWRVRGVI